MTPLRSCGFYLKLVADLGMAIPRPEISCLLSADLPLAYAKICSARKKPPTMQKLHYVPLPMCLFID